MFHLINYFDHYPMSLYDVTRMGSNVEEYHDAFLEEDEQSDLSAQVLASKSTQVQKIHGVCIINAVNGML